MPSEQASLPGIQPVGTDVNVFGEEALQPCGRHSAQPFQRLDLLAQLRVNGTHIARDVISEQQEGKRVYRITEEGRSLLGEHGDRVSDFTDRFSDFTDRFSKAGMGDLTRSFVRLAQVSFERASRKAADPEALGKLQEILERATREVEENWPGPGKRASGKS